MKNANVKRMTGIALLAALVIVLQLLGGMIPPVGGFSISLVLIPIVLGAAAYGPAAGALLGGAFGAIVFINSVTGADGGGHMVFEANPVLCFIVVMGKGILAGLCSGLVYRAMKNANLPGYSAMLCAAIVCPVVNTGIFISCMLCFFKDVLSAWMSGWTGGGTLVAYILSGIVLVNFVPELIINIVFSPASERIIKFVKK